MCYISHCFCLNIFYFWFTGFGNVAPKTKGGRVFCILYGLCGIPLCLVWLSTLGSFFGDRAKRLSQVLIRRGVSVVRIWLKAGASLLLSGYCIKKQLHRVTFDKYVFFFSPFLSEKGPVNLYSLVPAMGAVCAPVDPSSCFHGPGRLDLPGRSLLLFHHTHNGWFWRLCGR